MNPARESDAPLSTNPASPSIPQDNGIPQGGAPNIPHIDATASSGTENVATAGGPAGGVDQAGQSSPTALTTEAEEIVRAFETRHLPSSIIVPPIQGEMQVLRPVRLEDLEAMDELDAFAHSSSITGYSKKAERAIVGTWVHDSVAWSMGDVDVQSAIEARGFERTIGWTMMTRLSGSVDPDEMRPIGMVFLTAIDAWSRDARLQVILGRDFRSRGYSRDAMPRIMTFAFAPSGHGLGLHRVSTLVPGKNQRSLSVYQSIGFTLDGVLRDKLWDDENDRYQDLNVLSTLADEYDPIRALDAWGMRVIPGNPGVKEALAAHGHSIALEKQSDLGVMALKTPEDFHDARATGGRPEDKAPLNPRDAGGRGAGQGGSASEGASGDASWQGASDHAGVASRTGRAMWETASEAAIGADADGVPASASTPDPAADAEADTDSGSADGADGVTRKKSKRAWWRRWSHGSRGSRGHSGGSRPKRADA